MDAEAELRDELARLRTAVARKLRAGLEADGPVSPAFLEAARKFLTDQNFTLGREPTRPKAPAVTQRMPFEDPAE